MILDSERQRELLIGVLNSVQVPGQLVDEIYALRQAVLMARAEEEDAPRQEEDA